MKIYELGRSMVEMLGVLAIIGVLSVTGIYGYTIAMNKYKANELLNQLNMRATHCMAQIQSGKDLSVDSFGDYNGYSFTAEKVGNDQFKLTISGTISDAVCTQMLAIVDEENGTMFINDDCLTVLFNNDLSEGVIPNNQP